MKTIALVVLLSLPLQAQDACEQSLAELQSCNADLDASQAHRLRLNSEANDLERILSSNDHERSLRQCVHANRRLDREIQEAKRELRPLERSLQAARNQHQEKVREYERKRGPVVHYECLVSDKKYAENGVGIGRTRDQAIENAVANTRADEIRAMNRRISNENNPSTRARLTTERNNMVRHAQATKKNGVYPYCYPVYRNDRDILTLEKIYEGPRRALSNSGSQDNPPPQLRPPQRPDRPVRPDRPRRPPNRGRG